MQAKRVFMLALVPPVAVALLAAGVATASGSSGGRGLVRITKQCSATEPICTITSSNVAAIPVGSRVLYSERYSTSPGMPPGWLDSGVVLDANIDPGATADDGNWAVGRCTISFANGRLGVCTFSDGSGTLAGFQARVDVSPPAAGSADWTWRGKYGFDIFWPWR